MNHDVLIAIADDDRLMVSLLEDYLNRCAELCVIITASGGEELMAKLNEAKELPDVLLIDLKMKGIGGIETIEQVKERFDTIKIIVISAYYKHSFSGFLFKTGASAFLPKGISPSELQFIIKTVYWTDVYLMKDQINDMRSQIDSRSPKPILDTSNELSQREVEVLKLICLQKTAKEIGEKLFITTKTVEGHKNNLFIKTGAKNIAGLVIYAIQQNILDVKELPMV